MGIEAEIKDGEGTNGKAGVRTTNLYGSGIKSYTYSGTRREHNGVFALNDTYGSNMNQDASVGGTPDQIHDGIDSVLWTASALSGTWTFNSTAQAHTGTRSIDATATVNSNEAQFQRGSTVDLSNYVSITGWVYLTSWSTSGTKGIGIRFRDSGIDGTDELDLSAYIDTTLFNSWQKFSIPLSTFTITDSTIDQLVVKTIDIGAGPPPNYYLDDIQLEETGGAIIYDITPQREDTWRIHSLHFTMVDAYAGTVASGTMQGIPYDGFLAINTLSNGISIQRIQDDKIEFSIIFNDFIDILASTAEKKVISGSDGTNTWVTVELKFPEPFDLHGKHGDRIEIAIQDDLSGLLFFKVSASISINVDIDL
jgi:hypothetical protein